jgi:NADPH-dependent 2,4-dienoyl-CoA reductase/sulfur reductase-like enzyme
MSMAEKIPITLAGQAREVDAGTTAAAAYLQAGCVDFRRSVTNEPRGPLCGMGICHECRLTINGEPHAKSCQIVVEPGMAIDANGHEIRGGMDETSKPAEERSFDVLIVGAGPGGIAAAVTAAECGKTVGLIDDNPDAGGQIWRGERQRPHHADAKPWFDRLLASKVERIPGTQVVAAPSAGWLLAVRHGQALRLRYRKLILATGAREIFLPFPGWTLPGVMGVGGLQAMVKSGLPIAGKKIVIAGTGPLLLAVAAHLREQRADLRVIAEQTTFGKLAGFTAKLFASQPGKIAQAVSLRWRLRGVPYRAGCWPTRAEGANHLQAATLTDGQRTWSEPCDYLACGFGLTPNLELARLLGCAIESSRVKVDAAQQTTTFGVFAVGELTGVGGVDKALLEGRIAGYAASEQSDKALSFLRPRDRWRSFCGLLEHAFALRDELRRLPADDTLVCRCEDVTHGRLAVCGGSREAKLHTRCGMGPCQGRVCGPATAFLYGWDADSVRPPIAPCRIDILAALNAE